MFGVSALISHSMHPLIGLLACLLSLVACVTLSRAAPLQTTLTTSSNGPLARSLSDPHAYEFFAVKFTRRRASRSCHVTAPLHHAQPHRLLTSEDDVHVRERLVEHEAEGWKGQDASGDGELVTELVGRKRERVEEVMAGMCSGVTFEEEDEDPSGDDDEVIEIIKSGSPQNRIDVVFMGDGYVKSERARFVADIQRLAHEMFAGQTFHSVLPFFNIWAVFRPSKESGIGTEGTPKNTAFGLYRDGTELRGIYTSKPKQAREVCRKAGFAACDFPSLIGNDEFYGGLGGEFVISTRSETSGTVVLRHEMGHNFVDVGEEYDGGYVYSGVNAATDINSLGWAHWLSQGGRSEQRNALRIQDYSWYDLSRGPYRINFESDGGFSRWWMTFSTSGMDGDSDLEVYLDGEKLAWKSCGLLDRCFYGLHNENIAFTAGEHFFEFRSSTGSEERPKGRPIRQLCSVTMLEYGTPEQFHWDPSYISAYPTYSLTGKVTYRPSNEGCLMRNMSSPRFCSVCKEGMWMQFLARVDLIDSLSVDPGCGGLSEDGSEDILRTEGQEDLLLSDSSHSSSSGRSATVTLQLLPFGQFRSPDYLPRDFIDRGKEHYHINWYRDGKEQRDLHGRTSWTMDSQDSVGRWRVRVRLETPEVRHDPKDLLSAEREFFVPYCGWRRRKHHPLQSEGDEGDS